MGEHYFFLIKEWIEFKNGIWNLASKSKHLHVWKFLSPSFIMNSSFNFGRNSKTMGSWLNTIFVPILVYLLAMPKYLNTASFSLALQVLLQQGNRVRKWEMDSSLLLAFSLPIQVHLIVPSKGRRVIAKCRMQSLTFWHHKVCSDGN